MSKFPIDPHNTPRSKFVNPTVPAEILMPDICGLLGTLWLSLKEFCLEGREGYCWIIHKGHRVEAYYDRNQVFLFNRFSKSCYMAECIAYVQPMWLPDYPKEKPHPLKVIDPR